jgi:hypothetical protein
MMFVAWRSHVDKRRAMWIILMAFLAIIGKSSGYHHPSREYSYIGLF